MEGGGRQMEQSTPVKAPAKRASELYSEPLLIRHEPLRNITGQKYGEKLGAEKVGFEKLTEG
jgi:hypothetical protein